MVAQRKLREQVRIPITPSLNNRNSSSGMDTNLDQRFINCFLDVKQDNYSKEQITYAVKRPGVAVSQDFTNLPDAGTGSFTTQGFWIFHNTAYFINDNKLYYCAVPVVTTMPTLLYTFKVSTLETTADEQVWTRFGTEFESDFKYRAVELLNEGIEYLYITNGLEDVFIKEGSVLGDRKESYNRFTASAFYKAGDRVIPSSYALTTGYQYIVIGDAGTVSQASTEPTWPTTLGDIVVSGDVSFMCFATGSATTMARIYTDRAYSLGELVQPSTESGYFYEVTVAGTSTGEPASWTQIIGDTSTSTGGVEFTCIGNYGGKPGLALPMPVYLDSYLVLAPYKSSDLYNSGPSNIYSWNAVDFISADSFTSTTRAISRYNNYIIAYSDKDAELFYNNANTTGSPFSRHESFLLQVGTVGQETVIGVESIIAWAGISTAGTYSIWLLDGFEPKEISNPFINRMLSSNAINSSLAVRVAGHLFLVFNTNTVSLIFDIGLSLWYEWYTEDSGFNYDFFAFDSGTSATTNKYLMDSSKNEIFLFGDFLYEDYLTPTDTGTPIRVKFITQKIDFGNRYRKFGHSLDIIGDTYNPANSLVTSPDSTIDVYFSDDDYENIDPFNILLFPENAPKYSVDMTGRPRITPCGSFRRRAIMIEYNGNLPMRIEGFDLNYTQGIS